MNFTIYSKNGCPYCSKVVQVLEMVNLNYSVLKLGEDYERNQFYSKFGQGSTFPQVIVDGKSIGGCSDTVKYLKENNII